MLKTIYTMPLKQERPKLTKPAQNSQSPPELVQELSPQRPPSASLLSRSTSRQYRIRVLARQPPTQALEILSAILLPDTHQPAGDAAIDQAPGQDIMAPAVTDNPAHDSTKKRAWELREGELEGREVDV